MLDPGHPHKSSSLSQSDHRDLKWLGPFLVDKESGCPKFLSIPFKIPSPRTLLNETDREAFGPGVGITIIVMAYLHNHTQNIPDVLLKSGISAVEPDNLPRFTPETDPAVDTAIAWLCSAQFSAYARNFACCLIDRDWEQCAQFPTPEEYGISRPDISEQIARLLGIPELMENIRWSISGRRDGSYAVEVDVLPAPVYEAENQLKACIGKDVKELFKIISQYAPLRLQIDPSRLRAPGGPSILLENQLMFRGKEGLRGISNILRALEKYSNPHDFIIGEAHNGDLVLLGVNWNLPVKNQINLQISSDGGPFRSAALYQLPENPDSELVFVLDARICRINTVNMRITLDDLPVNTLCQRSILMLQESYQVDR